MSKEDIIFFDALGFGWVVDAETIRKIAPPDLNEKSLSERRLFDYVHRGGKDLTR